jgi:hypothetical protein
MGDSKVGGFREDDPGAGRREEGHEERGKGVEVRGSGAKDD